MKVCLIKKYESSYTGLSKKKKKVHTLVGERYNYITFVLIDFFSRAFSFSLIKEDGEKEIFFFFWSTVKRKIMKPGLSMLSRLGNDIVKLLVLPLKLKYM